MIGYTVWSLWLVVLVVLMVSQWRADRRGRRIAEAKLIDAVMQSRAAELALKALMYGRVK